MKHFITIILIFLIYSCSNRANQSDVKITHFETGFTLYEDTTFVNIKGDMTHALKYKDKYYILFEQRILKYGGYGKRWLYIFSNNQIEKVVDFPNELKTTYLDFYLKNDSLILKPYMEEHCYYFDLKNNKWNKIERTDDLIFEDENYKVFSLDFGEWGGKTWFKDKKTGQEYVLESTTPLVNKIDSAYYLTNPFKVLKVKNPRLLNKCSNDITYENIESTGKYYSWYGKSIGFVCVYQDTTLNYYEFKYRPHIVSSFVINNELLHIYETDTATYIARHKGYSIKPIQKIANNISFYDWYYSYRISTSNGENKIMKFQTENENLFGLLEIKENNIYVHYYSNSAQLTPKLLGSEKAKNVFKNRLKQILADLGKLDLSKIDLTEQKYGSFDITPNHKVGISESYYPNLNKYEIDTCKSYLIQEDSILSNSIIYYSTRKNCLVRVISIDWDFNDNFNNIPESIILKKQNQKASEIESCIVQLVGNPKSVQKTESFIEKEWKTSNGFTLFLQIGKTYSQIRFNIYKD